MKVVLLSSSDSLGGAAIVTHRLMNALRREGVDARMVVSSKLSDDPYVDIAGSSSGNSLCFVAERAGIFLNNGFSREQLFKVSTASHGRALSRHPWVKEADVVVLSWINQGLLSLREIRRIGRMGKPIVWIMHDMWNLTGICHHAYECNRYTASCGCCPYLRSQNPRDLSHRVWRRKMRLYDDVPQTFVAVSHWLADKCRESSLLRDRRIEVIPNAFPIDAFSITPHRNLQIGQLDYDKNIILMGAARLDDPIKGLDYAIDALNLLFEHDPSVAQTSQLVLFGQIRDMAVLDRLNFPFLHLGMITDMNVVHELYAAARVVLSTSLYETLPGTLIEGQASGAIPVTFDHGGQRDIVEHLKNGYIARYRDPRSVADGILWALREARIDAQQLHDSVRDRFSSRTVARRYTALFDSLLAGDKAQKNTARKE